VQFKLLTHLKGSFVKNQLAILLFVLNNRLNVNNFSFLVTFFLFLKIKIYISSTNFKSTNMSEVVTFFKKHKTVLSIRGVEKSIGLPNDTLIKAVNGRQSLPKKWEEPLKELIGDLSFEGLQMNQ